MQADCANCPDSLITSLMAFRSACLQAVYPSASKYELASPSSFHSFARARSILNGSRKEYFSKPDFGPCHQTKASVSHSRIACKMMSTYPQVSKPQTPDRRSPDPSANCRYGSLPNFPEPYSNGTSHSTPASSMRNDLEATLIL